MPGPGEAAQLVAATSRTFSVWVQPLVRAHTQKGNQLMFLSHVSVSLSHQCFSLTSVFLSSSLSPFLSKINENKYISSGEEESKREGRRKERGKSEEGTSAPLNSAPTDGEAGCSGGGAGQAGRPPHHKGPSWLEIGPPCGP